MKKVLLTVHRRAHSSSLFMMFEPKAEIKTTKLRINQFHAKSQCFSNIVTGCPGGLRAELLMLAQLFTMLMTQKIQMSDDSFSRTEHNNDLLSS